MNNIDNSMAIVVHQRFPIMADHNPGNPGNGNNAITQFFLSSLPYMMHHLIIQMPNFMKRRLSVQSHRGLRFEDDWKDIARNLGINSIYDLDEIEASAKTHNELPLFIALDKNLGYSSVGVIINCMLTMQRYDVLSHLEGYTREILSKKLTVLLLNAEKDNSTAEQIKEEFKKEDVIALTLAEMNNLALQVDFGVPVLSENFMEEIYPEYSNQLESDDRIFPVIVPGMNRALIEDKRLRYSFILWKEVPKLIKVLKEIKEKKTEST